LVKIRLKRMGAKKRPFYRLVVADSRSPRDGRFIELLGYYDPLTEPAKVQVDADKVREWMRKGARPSDAARDLLVREGILAKVARPFKPAPEVPEPAAAPAVAAAAAASETPGAPEEVDAVDAENAHLGHADSEEAEPATAADPEEADAAAAAEPAGDS
jgi:small subunit ribosomal protein S16